MSSNKRNEFKNKLKNVGVRWRQERGIIDFIKTKLIENENNNFAFGNFIVSPSQFENRLKKPLLFILSITN